MTLNRIIGDTLIPLDAFFEKNGDPLALSSYTVKAYMKSSPAGTVVLNDVTLGISQEPTQAFTANATTSRITCNGHGAKDGQQIIVASSGTLPAGLLAATRYTVAQRQPNSFSLEDSNGNPVDITDTGSGSHTFYIVGHARYDFSSASVASAGLHRLWLRVFDGSNEVATFPNTAEGILVNLVDRSN